MQKQTIGRSALIGALATATLFAPGRTAALQQAVTCANEPFLARTIAAAATPEAAASPPAAPAGSPSASPEATPAPLMIAWLDAEANPSAEVAVRRAAADVATHLIAPGAAN